MALPEQYMLVDRYLYIHLQGSARVHTLDFAPEIGRCKLNSDPDIWVTESSGWALNNVTNYQRGSREFSAEFHYAGDESYFTRFCQFRPYLWAMAQFPGRDAYLVNFQHWLEIKVVQ